MLKYLGILCVILAVIGIFVPLLPTTPLLLLALYIFARSSEKYKAKLLSNRFLKPYIEPYIDKSVKMPLHAKIKTLVLLWILIIISIFIVQNIYVTMFLLVISSTISIYIITIGREKITKK